MIDITNLKVEEMNKLRDGYIKARGNKIYWIYNNDEDLIYHIV